MKQYIFFSAAAAAVIFGAYWAGGRIAAEKCRAEFAQSAAAAAAGTTQKQNEIKRKIDVETFNTGAGDIRGFLRAAYTIAD